MVSVVAVDDAEQKIVDGIFESHLGALFVEFVRSRYSSIRRMFL